MAAVRCVTKKKKKKRRHAKTCETCERYKQLEGESCEKTLFPLLAALQVRNGFNVASWGKNEAIGGLRE